MSAAVRSAAAAAGLVLSLLLCARPASAQHSLVLSGGGARGLAHAGAVVALEELGYAPELVVGTSMGAIIGALYAAGYEPAAIYRTVLEENWLVRFAAEPVLDGPQRVPVRPVLSFGISRGRFYEGFIPTTGVNLRLLELLFDAGVRARNDFDRLPLRFRAVAADLSTGEELVLGSGDLPRAVRASMAVPGAFAPIEWNGRVLVDGGIANNLPVSVARTLSDAPVLAIDVLRPPVDVGERGPLDLGARAVRLLIENASPDGAPPEILVLPEIAAGLSEARFPADPTELLRGGYEAVLAQVPPAVSSAGTARRAQSAGPLRIDALRVETTDAALARLVRRTMQPALGEYDASDIIGRAAALYGTGRFQAVWPRLEFPAGDAGPATLVVAVTPVATTILTGAARWDNDVGAGGWLSLRQRLPLGSPSDMQAGFLADELRHHASLEASAFSLLLPGVVWSAGVHHGDERFRAMTGDTAAAVDRVRRTGGWAGAELRGPIRDWFVSALIRSDHIRRPGGSEGAATGPYLRISRPPRPERIIGVDPLIELETRAGIRYDRMRVRASANRSIGRTHAAMLGDVHLTRGDAPPDVRRAEAPDLLPWLTAGTLHPGSLAVLGLDAAHPLVLDGYARLRLRAAAAADDAGTLHERDAWMFGGEVGAIWPTFAGPLAVGTAVGGPLDGEIDWRLNASIGLTF